MPHHYTSEHFVTQFWNKVDTSGGDAACWLWTAGCFNNGYGRMFWHRQPLSTHRIAYELTFGEIDRGLFVCHRCDVRNCCNPAHLFLGTPQDNMDDKVNKGRGRSAYGEANGQCKLSDDQVAEIRDLHAMGGVTQRALARKFGVSPATVCLIVNRKGRT